MNVWKPVRWNTVLPKHELARDLTYDRQQLLWQNQKVTVTGFIDCQSQIDENLGNFDTPSLSPSAIDWTLFLCEEIIAPSTLFFVTADAYNQSFCEFFGVANVNSFLSLNQMKLISYSNCFEQMTLARQFASVSYSAGSL